MTLLAALFILLADNALLLADIHRLSKVSETLPQTQSVIEECLTPVRADADPSSRRHYGDRSSENLSLLLASIGFLQKEPTQALKSTQWQQVQKMAAVYGPQFDRLRATEKELQRTLKTARRMFTPPQIEVLRQRERAVVAAARELFHTTQRTRVWPLQALMNYIAQHGGN